MDKKTLEKLYALRNVQGVDGNWNYSEYMMGLYNGMELMIATIEDREPVYKKTPDKWLEDMDTRNVEPQEASNA